MRLTLYIVIIISKLINSKWFIDIAVLYLIRQLLVWINEVPANHISGEGGMAFGFSVLLSGHCSYVTCHKRENVCNQNKQTWTTTKFTIFWWLFTAFFTLSEVSNHHFIVIIAWFRLVGTHSKRKLEIVQSQSLRLLCDQWPVMMNES